MKKELERLANQAKLLMLEENTVIRIDDLPEDICIHHIDGDWKNNAIKNLIPACRSCHSKLHNLKGGYYAKRIKSVR